jgi:hypothetical protein
MACSFGDGDGVADGGDSPTLYVSSEGWASIVLNRGDENGSVRVKLLCVCLLKGRQLRRAKRIAHLRTAIPLTR